MKSFSDLRTVKVGARPYQTSLRAETERERERQRTHASELRKETFTCLGPRWCDIEPLEEVTSGTC